jgi:hypothetical protein
MGAASAAGPGRDKSNAATQNVAAAVVVATPKPSVSAGDGITLDEVERIAISRLKFTA